MRTTEKLNPSLLKQHRKAAGLSQEDLAKKALTKSEGYSENSQLRTYQKIEEDGITSPKGAKLLAKALGVSVSDLKQLDFEIGQKRLTELLKSAVEKMKTANDKLGLARISKEFGVNQDDSLCEWDTIQNDEYASLAGKIEWLHLFGEPGELESYAKLFGVTSQELRPAPLASFWLFSSSSYFLPSLGNVVSGYAGVLAEIEKNLAKLPNMLRDNYRSGTITATILKEESRYRLRFEFANFSSLSFSCLFYACNTKENIGMPSRNATVWEHEMLMRSLKDFLFDHADTVIIEGKQYPPEQSNAAFHIRSFNVSDGNEQHEIGTRIIDVNYLFRGSLQELLRKHDACNWRFTNPDMLSPSYIFPGVELSLVENNHVIKIYKITTGWRGFDGNFHAGHWPLISRKQFIESILGARDSLIITDENGEIPPFEPEPVIELFPPKSTSEAYQVRFFNDCNNEVIPSRKVNFENRFLLHFSLQTFLEKHGNAKWRFDPPKSHIFRGIRMQLHENVYCRINLGWLDSQGEFQDGTWSEASREEFIKRAQDLQNKFMYVPNENEVIPSFELVPQAITNKGCAV